MNTTQLIERSQHSSLYLWLLNLGLARMIPFNKPHKFKILKIEKGAIQVKLPFRKRNLNHIRGLHACALATLAEYSTGLTLITCLDPGSYRIIMQKIEMDYFYQGKTDAITSFSITDDWLNTHVLDVIQTGIPATVDCDIDIYDQKQNKLAKGKITWQIKSWNDVKTKP